MCTTDDSLQDIVTAMVTLTTTAVTDINFTVSTTAKTDICSLYYCHCSDRCSHSNYHCSEIICALLLPLQWQVSSLQQLPNNRQNAGNLYALWTNSKKLFVEFTESVGFLPRRWSLAQNNAPLKQSIEGQKQHQNNSIYGGRVSQLSGS